MKKVLQKISIASLGLLTPALAFAGTENAAQGLSRLLNQVGGLMNQVVPLLIGLAVIAFMWGVVMYLFGKDKDGAKSFMLWGIIAIAVMVSIWGLVGILRSTLGVDGSANNKSINVDIPKV
jgi:hypothetical protein